MKTYICNCGREFENKQSYCSHCGHCIIRLKLKGKEPTDRLKDYRNWNKGKTFIKERLIENSSSRNRNIKRYLLNENIKDNRCEICGINRWNGKEIILQLHHINGNNKDNRLSNLLLLCPNCHSLTDTYCKNKRKK